MSRNHDRQSTVAHVYTCFSQVLVLAWKCGAEKMCRFSRTEFFRLELETPPRSLKVRAGLMNCCISSQGLPVTPGGHAAGPQVSPSRGRGRGQDGPGRLQGPLPLHLPVRAGRGAEGAARRDGGQPLALGLLPQRATPSLPLGPISAGKTSSAEDNLCLRQNPSLPLLAAFWFCM